MRLPINITKRAGLMTLVVVSGLGGVGQANADFFQSSYNANFTFQDQLGHATSTSVAYDGTHYWSSAGGSSFGIEYAEYSSSGSLIATYAPGLDFRSIFTDASGTVFARQYNDATIYKQISPGAFASSGVVLAPNSLDPQSSVVLNSASSEYDAMSGGAVSRWNLAGNSLGTVSLVGFGGTEAGVPQGRGLAVAGNYWLTYDPSDQKLSAWDFAGNRVGTTILNGAGTSSDSAWSFSYANGMVFIVDQRGGTWRGYDVGLNGQGPAAAPEPASLTLLGIGAAGLLGYASLRRRRASKAACAA